MTPLTRRDWLTRTPAALAAGAIAAASPGAARANGPAPSEPFGYCLNTSTIMGQKLPVVEQMQIAAKAGFGAVEPWLRDLDEYAKGGSLADLKKRIADLGLKIPSAIGFAEWAVDDDSKRARGIEQMKRDMETVRAIGGTRIAAPPVGATDRSDMDPRKLAERYRAILELGDKIGVVPELEVWGFSKTLSRLGEAAMVAIDAGHPSACILADVFHLYRGGSDFSGIALLNGRSLGVFHLNDYPADPPRREITDAQRIYPGDGVALLGALFRSLRDIGYDGFLSLELFNRDLWKEDALKVARTGLEKLKAAVQGALDQGREDVSGRGVSIAAVMLVIAATGINLAVARSVPAALLLSIPASIAAIRTLLVWNRARTTSLRLEFPSVTFAATFFAALLAEIAGGVAFVGTCTAINASGQKFSYGMSERFGAAVFTGSVFGIALAIAILVKILRAFGRDTASRERLRSKPGE